MRPIIGWPKGLMPIDLRLQANSHTQDGFISNNSLENEIRIPGARVRLHMDFGKPQTNRDAELYSWIMSVGKGSIILVDLWSYPQTAQDADFERSLSDDLPYSSGQRHSSGFGFAYSPMGRLASEGLKGDNKITIDTGFYPNSFRRGKWFSINYAPYMVDEVMKGRFKTEITVTPPLLKNYDSGQKLRLLPRGGFKFDNLDSFSSNFKAAGYAKPGSIVLSQVIDDRLL